MDSLRLAGVVLASANFGRFPGAWLDGRISERLSQPMSSRASC
jgi:hypothetical protein